MMPTNSNEYDRRYRSLRKESVKTLVSMMLKQQEELENLRKEMGILAQEMANLRKGSLDSPLRRRRQERENVTLVDVVQRLTAEIASRAPLLSLNGSPDKEERVSPAPLPKEETNLSLIPLIPNLIRSLDNEFEEVWALFPRKTAKGKAREKYRAARKQASFDTILTGIRKHALECQTTEKQYIPHPATWLHQQRWLDEEGAPNGHDPEPEMDPADAERLRQEALHRVLAAAGLPVPGALGNAGEESGL
jgi:hypothetical protein